MLTTLTHQQKGEWEELLEFFSPKGFTEVPQALYHLENKNLMVYFNRDRNEWRFKDCSMTGSYAMMDLMIIRMPLDDKEKQVLWSICSSHYKEDWSIQSHSKQMMKEIFGNV